MLNEKENPYLARWLNNDLSSEELEELKSLPEYEDYQRIVEGLTHFKAPSFDVQPSFAVTLGKIFEPKKAKIINLKPIVYTISVAASIVLIIGIFFNKVTYTTKPGEQLAIVLPDNSSVALNAVSTLKHSRFFWSKNREITLQGEAYFKVSSGTNFTVATNQGTVQVLGTQFNVKSRSNDFEVSCYEGKVRVSVLDDQQEILERGEGVRLKDKHLQKEVIKNSEPLWKKGESIFNTVRLKKVLDELERQYNITFKRGQINENMFYTGGFNYNDLHIALEAVLVPMGIAYSVNGTMVSLSMSK